LIVNPVPGAAALIGVPGCGLAGQVVGLLAGSSDVIEFTPGERST
jgi:hypothetical protein